MRLLKEAAGGMKKEEEETNLLVLLLLILAETEDISGVQISGKRDLMLNYVCSFDFTWPWTL